MYECIKPTQYIKEHEDDFLIFKGNVVMSMRMWKTSYCFWKSFT